MPKQAEYIRGLEEASAPVEGFQRKITNRRLRLAERAIARLKLEGKPVDDTPEQRLQRIDTENKNRWIERDEWSNGLFHDALNQIDSLPEHMRADAKAAWNASSRTASGSEFSGFIGNIKAGRSSLLKGVSHPELGAGDRLQAEAIEARRANISDRVTAGHEAFVAADKRMVDELKSLGVTPNAVGRYESLASVSPLEVRPGETEAMRQVRQIVSPQGMSESPVSTIPESGIRQIELKPVTAPVTPNVVKTTEVTPQSSATIRSSLRQEDITPESVSGNAIKGSDAPEMRNQELMDFQVAMRNANPGISTRGVAIAFDEHANSTGSPLLSPLEKRLLESQRKTISNVVESQDVTKATTPRLTAEEKAHAVAMAKEGNVATAVPLETTPQPVLSGVRPTAAERADVAAKLLTEKSAEIPGSPSVAGIPALAGSKLKKFQWMSEELDNRFMADATPQEKAQIARMLSSGESEPVQLALREHLKTNHPEVHGVLYPTKASGVATDISVPVSSLKAVKGNRDIGSNEQGAYDLTHGDRTVRVFRSQDDGYWYADSPGHFSDNVVGFNKKELVRDAENIVARHHAKQSAASAARLEKQAAATPSVAAKPETVNYDALNGYLANKGSIHAEASMNKFNTENGLPPLNDAEKTYLREFAKHSKGGGQLDRKAMAKAKTAAEAVVGKQASGVSAGGMVSPLYEAHGDENMVARVFKHDNGYSVSMSDKDAGKTVDQMRIFPTLDGAKEHANTIKPVAKVTDVTPEGYGPVAATAGSLPTSPLDVHLGTDAGKLRASINEANTILKGNVSGAQRSAIERTRDNAQAKLRELEKGTRAPSADEIDKPYVATSVVSPGVQEADKLAKHIVEQMGRNGLAVGHPAFAARYRDMPAVERKNLLTALVDKGLLPKTYAKTRSNFPTAYGLEQEVIGMAKAAEQAHKGVATNRHIPFTESEFYKKATGGGTQQSSAPATSPPNDDLVKEAVRKWGGESSTLRIHLKDIAEGVPPSGATRNRNVAEALKASVDTAPLNKQTLYRGSHEDPSGIESWTSDKSVAEAWAKKGGGKVYEAPPGTVRAIRSEEYGSGAGRVEGEWIGQRTSNPSASAAPATTITKMGGDIKVDSPSGIDDAKIGLDEMLKSRDTDSGKAIVAGRVLWAYDGNPQMQQELVKHLDDVAPGVRKYIQENHADTPKELSSLFGKTVTAKPDESALESAYSVAKLKLDAIGPEPRRPSPEKRVFPRGRAGVNPELIASHDADTKAYQSWRRKYSALKKTEVETSNALYRAKATRESQAKNESSGTIKSIENKPSPQKFSEYNLSPKTEGGWQVSDEVGGRAFGSLRNGEASITEMHSVPQDKRYTPEEASLKRRGFFRGLIGTLKDNGAKTVRINLQSQDTRKAVARLVEKGELVNPREMTGLSVDQHPTLFDIPGTGGIKAMSAIPKGAAQEAKATPVASRKTDVASSDRLYAGPPSTEAAKKAMSDIDQIMAGRGTTEEHAVSVMQAMDRYRYEGLHDEVAAAVAHKYPEIRRLAADHTKNRKLSEDFATKISNVPDRPEPPEPNPFKGMIASMERVGRTRKGVATESINPKDAGFPYDMEAARVGMDKRGYAEYGEHKVKVVPHPNGGVDDKATFAVQHLLSDGQGGANRTILPTEYKSIEEAQNAALNELSDRVGGKVATPRHLEDIPESQRTEAHNEHMPSRDRGDLPKTWQKTQEEHMKSVEGAGHEMSIKNPLRGGTKMTDAEIADLRTRMNKAIDVGGSNTFGVEVIKSPYHTGKNAVRVDGKVVADNLPIAAARKQAKNHVDSILEPRTQESELIAKAKVSHEKNVKEAQRLGLPVPENVAKEYGEIASSTPASVLPEKFTELQARVATEKAVAAHRANPTKETAAEISEILDQTNRHLGSSSLRSIASDMGVPLSVNPGGKGTDLATPGDITRRILAVASTPHPAAIGKAFRVAKDAEGNMRGEITLPDGKKLASQWRDDVPHGSGTTEQKFAEKTLSEHEYSLRKKLTTPRDNAEAKKHDEWVNSQMNDAVKAVHATLHPEALPHVATLNESSGFDRQYRVEPKYNGTNGLHYQAVYDVPERQIRGEVVGGGAKHATHKAAEEDIAEHLMFMNRHGTEPVIHEPHAKAVYEKLAAKKASDTATRVKTESEEKAKAEATYSANAQARPLVEQMVAAAKGKKRPVSISLEDKSIESVPATVYGEFAVRKIGAKAWGVTHVGTGLNLKNGGFTSAAAAKEAAVLVGAKGDWSFTDQKFATPETIQQVSRVMRALDSGDYAAVHDLVKTTPQIQGISTKPKPEPPKAGKIEGMNKKPAPEATTSKITSINAKAEVDPERQRVVDSIMENESPEEMLKLARKHGVPIHKSEKLFKKARYSDESEGIGEELNDTLYNELMNWAEKTNG